MDVIEQQITLEETLHVRFEPLRRAPDSGGRDPGPFARLTINGRTVGATSCDPRDTAGDTTVTILAASKRESGVRLGDPFTLRLSVARARAGRSRSSGWASACTSKSCRPSGPAG